MRASEASSKSRCASSKKKHNFGFGRSPASGRLSYSWASIQSMNVLNSRGRSITSDSSRMLMTPSPSGVVRSRSSISNSGSPKKTSAPSCSSTTIDRSRSTHGCRRHSPVIRKDGLALVGGEELERRRQVLQIQQRQVVVVAVLEDEREDPGLGVVEVQHLAQQQGPKEWTVAPTCAPSLPVSDRYSTGWPAGCKVQARESPAPEFRVRRVAGGGEPGEVALDIGDEDRDPRPGHWRP